VVSYHLKNRQNQHVLGGNTADRTDVYGQHHRAGDVFDITFDIPIHIQQGDYSLTVRAASIKDVERHTDVVSHLRADDVATLKVTPKQRFPLSDFAEPPPVFSVLNQKPWVVLDDFFPNLLTGFRVAEYNALLDEFPQFTVLSTLSDFAEQHRQYTQHYPGYATRVQPFSPRWLVACGLAYLNFLNNAAHYLPMLEKHGIPFVLTLYPGGGFGLNEKKSDDKLARVLSSAQLQALIVTQPVTEQYVHEFAQRRHLTLPAMHRIDGVVVNPMYFDTFAPTREAALSGAEFNICFVAECYMPLGANKGYPEFIEAAIALADQPQLHWHVVGGGFSAGDLNVSGQTGHLRYYGRLDTASLRKFFGGMDLIVSPNRPHLLHPGNFDGFPTGCCVEASLCGVAIMATDALQQNPGYVDGESIFLLSDCQQTLAQQIEDRIRTLLAHPNLLTSVAQAGRILTQQLYAPQRQIGERQRILREAGQRLAGARP
jgi:lipopolysaccharide transport system ATP-binding protein